MLTKLIGCCEATNTFARSASWCSLSRNPAAIHLLEADPDKIHWSGLSWNPASIHLFYNKNTITYNIYVSILNIYYMHSKHGVNPWRAFILIKIG